MPDLKNALTKGNQNIAILILIVLVIAFATNAAGYWSFPKQLTSTGTGQVISGGIASGPAYCPATGTSSPATSPPPGCYNQALILQITPQAFYASAVYKAAATYSAKIWVNNANGWYSPETILSSSGGIFTSGNTYLPGTQITVQLCKDSGPACTTSDYAVQKTIMYCPLPSVAGSGLCGAGPGAGYVPFSTTPSASTAPTAYFTMPIVPTAWDGDRGLANNVPNCLAFTWQNGTQVPAAPCTAQGTATVFVKNSGAGAPTVGAGTNGRFVGQLAMLFGTSGTIPANPWGAGYASYTPVDLQTTAGVACSPGTVGCTARGSLNVALLIQVKATTGSDMCFPTSPIWGVSPTILPRNSATDIMYVYILPDSAVTKIVDSSGNILNNGQLSSQVTWDCSGVFSGGSTDVVLIASTVVPYFSLAYFKATSGTINQEVPAMGSIFSNTIIGNSLTFANQLTVKQ